MLAIPCTDRKEVAVTLVALSGPQETIVHIGRAPPWIGRMSGLGVRADPSSSGRVCLAVDLRNSTKLSAEKFMRDQ